MEINESDLARLECPHCHTTGSLRIEVRLVAKPLGSYSIAGAQPKVVATQIPHLVCTKANCGFILAAKRDQER